jgi:hypothetical protein
LTSNVIAPTIAPSTAIGIPNRRNFQFDERQALITARVPRAIATTPTIRSQVVGE